MSELRHLREIPSVSEVLQAVLKENWPQEYHREQLLRAIREELSDLRIRLKNTQDSIPELKDLMANVQKRLTQVHSHSLKRVINATGVIVHTNLGRAPLSLDALSHLIEVAAGYSNLEFDLLEGQRGSREVHVENLLSHLLPVEASLVVNNNAAALLLILNTFAEGKEVLVSRGELVEIGGSFRLPEIMKKSGAILKEIGTTNKTRLQDYRKALTEKTGLILVVHPSNYQIVGFTEKPSLQEIATLGKLHKIPVVEDHGSGILLDLKDYGISDEPSVTERLHEGIDLICFSGDKILGGPQAGIVCGAAARVDELRKNPLFRALRVDKLVYAALEATLLHYLRGRMEHVPVIRMLSQSSASLHSRASAWLTELQKKFPQTAWSMEPTTNYIGGGVAPMKGIESYAVSLQHPQIPADEIARNLRKSEPPIVARIEGDRVLLELRTITEAEQDLITSVLEKILSPHS